MVRTSVPTSRPNTPLFPAELDPGPLRDALLERTDVRALLALVRLNARERPMSVLDDEEKTVVRLSLEEVALAGPTGDDGSHLRPRLRVTPIRGYEKERCDVP